MSFYSRHVLPRLIEATCTTKPVRKQREKVVPLCEGRVLEIGVGTGLNFPFYVPDRVSEVFGLDVSVEMMRDATDRAAKAHLPFEPLVLDAATIPLERDAVDTVLVTYSLCSIGALAEALAEMRRVLKPGGRLVFCEHGAAPDPGVRRFQDRLTPLWRRIAGGCHLNREIPAEIGAAGFEITEQSQMYLPGTWRFVGFNTWGTAVPKP